MIELISATLQEAHEALTRLRADTGTHEAIRDAGDMLADCLASRGRVFSCGNGGSMCDAMHFAEELTGRYRENRPAFAATAISDPGHLTCVGNDYGYEQVFSRYIEAHGRPGDCLVAITTSGGSRNVIAAAEKARSLGMKVIGLTGRPGSPMAAHCDIEICTPAGRFADRVQELHIKVLHILIEIIERRIGAFPA